MRLTGSDALYLCTTLAYEGNDTQFVLMRSKRQC